MLWILIFVVVVFCLFLVFLVFFLLYCHDFPVNIAVTCTSQTLPPPICTKTSHISHTANAYFADLCKFARIVCKISASIVPTPHGNGMRSCTGECERFAWNMHLGAACPTMLTGFLLHTMTCEILYSIQSKKWKTEKLWPKFKWCTHHWGGGRECCSDLFFCISCASVCVCVCLYIFVEVTLCIIHLIHNFTFISFFSGVVGNNLVWLICLAIAVYFMCLFCSIFFCSAISMIVSGNTEYVEYNCITYFPFATNPSKSSCAWMRMRKT